MSLFLDLPKLDNTELLPTKHFGDVVGKRTPVLLKTRWMVTLYCSTHYDKVLYSVFLPAWFWSHILDLCLWVVSERCTVSSRDETRQPGLVRLWSYRHPWLFICISLWATGNVAEPGSAELCPWKWVSRGQAGSQTDALSLPQIINAWGRWRWAVSCSTGEKVTASGGCRGKTTWVEWVQEDLKDRSKKKAGGRQSRLNVWWLMVQSCGWMYNWCTYSMV